MTLGVSPSALYQRVTTLLQPWIVSSHHFTTAVTEGDRGQGPRPPLLCTAYEQRLADAPQWSWVFEKQSCCLRGVGDGALSAVDTRNELGFIAQDFTMPM
jgi:hypothetical protein